MDLDFVFIAVAFMGIAEYYDEKTVAETTVIEIAKRTYEGISMESYTVGKISLNTAKAKEMYSQSETHSLPTEVLKGNKKIKLSKDEIADLFIQLQNTPIKRDSHLEQDNVNDSYLVSLEGEGGLYNELLFTIERDESLKQDIITILNPGEKIIDNLVVEGQDLYNMIANLVEKVPE